MCCLSHDLEHRRCARPSGHPLGSHRAPGRGVLTLPASGLTGPVEGARTPILRSRNSSVGRVGLGEQSLKTRKNITLNEDHHSNTFTSRSLQTI